VHTLFLRRPFGCNPTFAGPGLEDQSWYAVCEDESVTWTIDYFTGLTCSVYDRTEFAPTPSACDLNLKDEYEREFCFAKTLPDEVDPFGAGAGLYGALFIDTYSNLDCSGAPSVAGPITPGSCSPFGPAAWASLITVPEPSFPTQIAAALTTLALIRRRLRGR
jgi:hypothetical protein